MNFPRAEIPLKEDTLPSLTFAYFVFLLMLHYGPETPSQTTSSFILPIHQLQATLYCF